MRSGSTSGSDASHSHLQRRLSNASSARGVPHSASVFDLNTQMGHHHSHGYPAMQQVIT